MATTEIHTLSLHDALPIAAWGLMLRGAAVQFAETAPWMAIFPGLDRKSTRLNSSHEWISYAVFCLKKKRNAPRSIFPPEPAPSLSSVVSTGKLEVYQCQPP